jgi:hypothetical protein
MSDETAAEHPQNDPWLGYAFQKYVVNKAPEHDASWYFKLTLVAIVYFNFLHVIIHIMANRFI